LSSRQLTRLILAGLVLGIVLEELERFGCSNRVASFVLPMGYSLPKFHLPQAGVLLLLGADHFLDMGRTGINVVGNSIAAALVSRWEGELHQGQATCTRSAQTP
jgi:Na+/H+-dicarboxylate symporter